MGSNKGMTWLNKTTEDFKKEVFDLVGDDYSVESEYKGYGIPIVMKHNPKYCITDKTFEMTPNIFKKGRRCPYCSNRTVFNGINDIATVRPDLVKYLLNPEDAYKYHYNSSKKVLWKCPFCGEIFERNVSDVNRRGFSCPRCSDGISYPNKFIYNILVQFDDIKNLKREYRPKWCTFILNNRKRYGIYDIYFELYDIKYIIEMDGGLGHGNRQISKTDEGIEIDLIKDKLAEEHNIKVIRIDCDYQINDRFMYIKNNILKSELSKIINITDNNFIEADKKSADSNLIKSIELWNQGCSIKDISNFINMSESTITKYLKYGFRIGLCDYNSQKSIERSSSNKVVLLEELRLFDSIIKASASSGVSESSISKCCRGIQKSTYANGNELHWMYYKDYIKNFKIELVF